MDAIIFASCIPTEDKLYIAKEFFEVFEQQYRDTDIYVGINGVPCAEYLQYLEEIKKKLNVQYKITTKNLEVKSDASAFQTALKLLKDSKKYYKYIWFGHSKGVFNPSHVWRIENINELFKKRKEITELLNTTNAGSYALLLTKVPNKGLSKDVLEQFYKFKKAYFNSYLYLHTMYVLRGRYVHNFLNACNSSFFTSNLVEELGADIYMFERDFPQIVWRQGGVPLYKTWDTKLIFGGALSEEHYKKDVGEYFD